MICNRLCSSRELNVYILLSHFYDTAKCILQYSNSDIYFVFVIVLRKYFFTNYWPIIYLINLTKFQKHHFAMLEAFQLIFEYTRITATKH